MNLSLRAFADKLGVSHSAITRWEKDIDSPSEDGIAALSILAGSTGHPEMAYTFSLLLSGSLLGRIFVGFDLAKKQIGLIEAQLKHAGMLLETDVPRAKIMLQHAIGRAAEVLKQIDHDAHLKPQKPEVEYRGRHNPAAN